MQRDVNSLADREFDVLIVGGGIYGAWIARDAAQRGLSVALIERGDFGSGTSANNYKLIHGGLRYLQHADFVRMRESIREQRALRRVAPHLVNVMPCLVPTYGLGMRGMPAMRVALTMNDMISWDRNHGVESTRQLPPRKFLSPSEVKGIIPGVNEQGLTGGAIWHDGQMRNPDRLLWSVLRSAVADGARIANYVEARSLLQQDQTVNGVLAYDHLSEEEFEIRAKMTVNAAGPWVDTLLGDVTGEKLCPKTQAWNIVLKRQLVADMAVGLYSSRSFADSDRKISRSGRLIFFAPWRGRTMIGTSHRPLTRQGKSPDLSRDREEMLDLLVEAMDAYPAAELSEEDIAFAHCGVLPGTADPVLGDVKLLKHYVLRDHKKTDHVSGLITCVGVKYTTARDVAEKVVNCVGGHLGARMPNCRTAETPIWGGDFDNWGQLVATVKSQCSELSISGEDRIPSSLAENYGTEWKLVLDLIRQDAALGKPVDESSLLGEVLHAVKFEMAVTLLDVVRRRTDIGTARAPSSEVMQACGEVMAAELGWSEEELAQQLRDAAEYYQPFSATANSVTSSEASNEVGSAN